MEELRTMLLALGPAALTGVGAWWLSNKKTKVEVKKALVEVDAAVIAAKQMENEGKQRLAHDERDNVVIYFERLMKERQTVHERDMVSVHTQLGEMGRKLDTCEKKHNRKDRLLIQLIERMKSKKFLTGSEEHAIYREAEEELKDEHEGS